MRGGALGSAGGKDAKRQRSEASIVKIFPLSGEWVQCVGCTPHLVLRTTFSHTGEKEEIFASPFTLHSSLKRKAAFTLAEVLITLGIIGVVAAMTMPTLINKTQNKQLQTAFKVAYSTFSQAVMNMREERGPGIKDYYAVQELDENGNFVSYPHRNEFYEDFYKYSKLKVIGECNYTGKIMNYNRTAEAYTAYIGAGTEKLKDALSNGMCSNVLVNGGALQIAFDVNGTKGPNQLGHDIFYFNLDENDKLKPKKMTKLYSEEELEDMEYKFNRGVPCSMQSKQQGNGVGCAYYAIVDINPDDNSKGYWESLP